ncbi:aminopeptidase [Acuticoccus mangrovi]|uniref:Aminopeptidase n=1 Tax=Acuticoccus mangrovi TaxID=2796142 RepID=A0A934MMQ9_9HYPH|nr:aminopeptidase [Acuticoccus mangrovi]
MTLDGRQARLATLCVTVGLDLRVGQELIVSAPIEAQPFVGHVAAAAYRAGASLVTCLYEDPALIRARFDHGTDEALDRAAGWLSDGVAAAYADGAARLFVYGPYPDLLTGVAPERIGRMHAAIAAASAAEGAYTADLRVNWCAVPFVTRSWARMVYPALPIAEATATLWDDVFEVVRLTSSDPLAAWRDHLDVLEARCRTLQALDLGALHFVGGGTDLMVGLADGHQWVGGRSYAANGALPVCNFPTEEVFTCPHRDRVEGRLAASRPLALGGTVIDGLVVTFRGGAAERIEAREGREMLEGLISGDAGARRLAEVGLVPCSSPVARKDVLFYNTLLDENAASHVAFGQSYSACIEAGRDPDAAGANTSALHIDCMIGHDAMDVDGILKGGGRRPIMRAGDFALD